MTNTRQNRRGRIHAAGIVAVVVVALAVSFLAADWWQAMPVGTRATYVGRQSCRECHSGEFERWQGSDHDLAMDRATDDSVLGDFNDATLEHYGVRSKMFRDGGRYMIETDGPTGELETFQIKYTFGARPLQQYMVEFGDGRVQVLPIAWDTFDKRWFHLYPDQEIPAGDWLHWTGAGQTWNYMCVECHSTGVERNYDVASDTYHTTYSEIDTSCEACHGPGSVHVELAGAKSLFWDRRLGYGLANLKKDAQSEIETCAPCHSRRRVIYPGYEPGEKYLDYYVPELLAGDHYHVDGQIKEEDYVYGSFIQSLMYHKDVRCTDCHDPHTTKLKLEGNHLCGQCHEPGKYDGPLHHRHPVGTPGAQCVNCHMPETTYMVVDPRRDHSLRVPRPDLTVELGTPNACNGCHKDKTPEWAADITTKWYGAAGRDDEPHFAHAIAAGRQQKPEAEEALTELAVLKKQPAIVRASAMTLLSRYETRNRVRTALELLDDKEPLVRAAAIGGLEDDYENGTRLALLKMLDDPMRLVRMEAARVLSGFGSRGMSVTQRQEFERGLKEYLVGLTANNDQAAAHVNRAVVEENRGDAAAAEAAYRTALRVDAEDVAARMNLALLLDRRGETAESESLLREVIELQPAFAEAHYSLGLLLGAEPARLDEAAAALAEASRLAPQNARMMYNHGIAQQQLDHRPEAERALEAAVRLDPSLADAVRGLAIFYTQDQRWREALAVAEHLLVLPGTSAADRQMVVQLRQMAQQALP
jgi:tetratricopeptide (TPR) repeat protein